MQDTGKSERGASTSQKVEAFLRNAIYQGRLKPRERLIEDDIAQQLGCSRGPVREAVLRLERDGMIRITPRRGTFIRDVSPGEVEIVFSIRGKLEGLCVRYMREDFTAEKKAVLLKALAAMKAASSAKDDERFLQTDMRLHRTIWKLSGKQQLYRTLNFVMNPLFFMVARAYSTKLNPVDEAYRNHEGYLETICEVSIGRVEREVERYWAKLYKDLNKAVFHRPAHLMGAFDDEDAGQFGLDDELSSIQVEA